MKNATYHQSNVTPGLYLVMEYQESDSFQRHHRLAQMAEEGKTLTEIVVAVGYQREYTKELLTKYGYQIK